MFLSYGCYVRGRILQVISLPFNGFDSNKRIFSHATLILKLIRKVVKLQLQVGITWIKTAAEFLEE